MAYFDPTSDTDKALLTYDEREAAELALVADLAEKSIVNFYTEKVGRSRFRVMLNGYKSNPSDVDSSTYPTFVEDMRLTVASVISWLLAQRQRDPDIVSEFDPGARSRTYRADRLSHFPPNWDFWLRKYDIRGVTWSL